MLKISEKQELNAMLEIFFLLLITITTILILNGLKNILHFTLYLSTITIIISILVLYTLRKSDITVSNSTSDKL
jgi:hypothetical protein